MKNKLFVILSFILMSLSGIGQNTEERGKNVIREKSYLLDGTTKIGDKASYFNYFGNKIQSQSWSVKTDRVWVTDYKYDNLGRPVLTSLSAPKKEKNLNYRSDFFINAAKTNFSNADFENDPWNPSKVSTDENTLGWYYSNKNTLNPYQDITNYPYRRTIYSRLNPLKVLATIGGNKIENQWKQSYSFTMPATTELTSSRAFNEQKYGSFDISKTVSRDVNGTETVVFTNGKGNVLAQARSGGSIANSRTIKIGKQGYVDIHIPEGVTGLSINKNGNNYFLYDLIKDERIYTSLGSLKKGFYRISVSNLDEYNHAGSPITVTYKENYYDYSLNEYDEADRLIKTYQPLNKLESTFDYNSLGQLLHTKSPDEGEAWFKYRKDGQIRYSQNSVQKKNGKISYTEYDEKGRPIESGVIKNSTVFTNLNPDAALVSGAKSEVTETLYDIADPNFENMLASANLSGKYKQTFVAGNVVSSKNENTQTWYSYDIYGRVIWLVQKITGLSGLKTIDYEYDPVTSQVTKVLYQKYNSSERFIHKYTYNKIGQLTAVATSENNNTFTPQAAYDYYETGELKRTTLAGGLQAIDYIYNLNGALKMMNNPNNKKDATAKADDVFGMALHYYDGDYARKNTPITVPTHIGGTDQYNGNIKGIEWNNGFKEQKPVSYTYSYNKNNWLEGANFISNTQSGSTKSLSLDSEEDNNRSITSYHQVTLKPGFHVKASSGSSFRIKALAAPSQPDDYKIYGITYDANGNIQRLNRNKNTENGSNKMDQLTYHYYKDGGKPGNRLAYVSDAVTSNTNADDIKSQPAGNYVYNEIGQLIENKQDGVSYSYTTSGLVDYIKKDGKVLVDFGYDDRGQRVFKKSYAKGNLVETTTYVRDASGSVMGIYKNAVIIENPIYGSSRIGVHYKNNNDVYQIADHLGNVRSVIIKNGANAVSITSKADYYPFGMPMPNRNTEGDYRYAYQGQEKDPETGMEAFELRLWDSRIGRWLTTDPAGQYSSPYLGMGNNPINGADSDGGFWQELGNWITGKGWISNEGLDYVNSHGITEFESHFSSNAFNQDKLGKHTISYVDNNGELNFHSFNNVDDFNGTINGFISFEVSFGLQAGADLSKYFGADLTGISEVLLSYEYNANNNSHEWFWSGKEGEARIKHGAEVSFYGVSVSGEIEHRHKNGKVISSDWKIQGSYSSLFQVGTEGSLIDKQAKVNNFSVHGASIGGKVLLGVEFKSEFKIDYGDEIPLFK